nr:recombinase family protein [Micromonospora thermarum]
MHDQTAWDWPKTGKTPVPVRQTPTGRWLVTLPEPATSAQTVARGLTVSQVVAEIGSGMNGHHRNLTRVLSDPAVSVLVVDRRDRLTRFGFEHLAASMAACGRRIVVLDEAETSDDLVRDVTEVLTSLCARLYERRSASRRAAKAVAVVTSAEPA